MILFPSILHLTFNKKRISQVVLLILAAFGLGEIIVSSYSLQPELSGRKDFTMEYLMGKALLSGVDPYLPLSELQSLHPFPDDRKMHQPTHPPVMALIGMPLALFPYTWAVCLWFIIEILLVFVSCHLLLRPWHERLPLISSITVSLALFAWDPFSNELINGQLNSILLLLLTCSWLQFKKGKNTKGGIFLGLAIAIKLLSWPLTIFLLIRRNWHGFLATGLTATVVNTIAIALIGPEPVWRYFTTTSSILISGWSADVANFSVWSLGRRLFTGAAGYGFAVDLVAPIYDSILITNIASKVIPIIFFFYSLYLAKRINNLGLAFGFMVCLSILFSPISWSHYLVMTTLPIAIASMTFLQCKGKYTENIFIYIVSFITIVLLSIPMSTTRDLMHFYEYERYNNNDGVVTHVSSFSAGLFTLTPLAAVLSLMWLLWLIDRRSNAEIG